MWAAGMYGISLQYVDELRNYAASKLLTIQFTLRINTTI